MFSTSMIASSTTTPIATTSPATDHHVDDRVEELEDEERSHERQRDRDQADERGSPLEQERRQDQDDEQDPEPERLHEVVERQVDEGGGPEEIGLDRDPLQAGAHLVHGLLDAVRDLQRVGTRQLLDDQHDPLSLVDRGVAPERLVVFDDLPEVLQANRLAVHLLDRHLRQLGLSDDRLNVSHVHPLAVRLDEAARADGEGLGVLEHSRSRAFAVVSMTVSSEMPYLASFFGSTWTCRCWSRSP